MGIPAMLVGVAYWFVAAVLAAVVSDGGPAWLNIGVLWAIWNGFKFLWTGPVSLAQLIRGHGTRQAEGKGLSQ